MRVYLPIFALALILSTGGVVVAQAQTSSGARSAEIIYQAETYTPPFYRGKALPTGESRITAVAYPDLAGTSLDPTRLHYKWIRDGVTLPEFTGTGKRLATFETSIASDETLLEVEIADPAGSYRAKKAIYINDRSAKVLIYVDNSALGVLYNQTVPKAFALSGTEASFVGAPYFFSAIGATDPAVKYRWSVGSEEATSLNRLTVRSEGGSGETPISLEVSQAYKLTQLGSYDFIVSFGNDRTQ